uniref:Uncharacterized protein n=1 Tax=viral metagenome TaxID=1070528 RepID=A0A6C0C271_9ZZZZ
MTACVRNARSSFLLGPKIAFKESSFLEYSNKKSESL